MASAISLIKLAQFDRKTLNSTLKQLVQFVELIIILMESTLNYSCHVSLKYPRCFTLCGETERVYDYFKLRLHKKYIKNK